MNPIEKLILHSGLHTQRDFAAAVGETEQAVYRWRTGRSAITLERYLKWCKILDFKDWETLFSEG